jgi:hypothetical protein
MIEGCFMSCNSSIPILRTSILLSLMAFATLVYAQTTGDKRLKDGDDKWLPVSEAIGRLGRIQPDGTYTVSYPRGDFDVKVGGLKLAPVLWMASAVTFSAPGDGAMMMGDILLTDDGVATVMSRLAAESIDVTALHTHLTRENPRLMFLHVESHGECCQNCSGTPPSIERFEIYGSDRYCFFTRRF